MGKKKKHKKKPIKWKDLAVNALIDLIIDFNPRSLAGSDDSQSCGCGREL